MKKMITKLLGVSVLVGLPLLAQAEVYICKDASGKTLTSDRPIMECQDRKVRVLGKNGMTTREIAPPLTDEQKRQKEIESEKHHAALMAAEEQRRQDRALLARYEKEIDIEASRQRALQSVNEQIKREEAAIISTEANLKKSRADAAAQSKVTPILQRKLDDLAQGIVDSKKIIAERQLEISQINEKYDHATKRFRELKGGTVAKMDKK